MWPWGSRAYLKEAKDELRAFLVSFLFRDARHPGGWVMDQLSKWTLEKEMLPFTSSISQAPLNLSPFLSTTSYSSLLEQRDSISQAARYQFGTAAFILPRNVFPG